MNKLTNLLKEKVGIMINIDLNMGASVTTELSTSKLLTSKHR